MGGRRVAALPTWGAGVALTRRQLLSATAASLGVLTFGTAPAVGQVAAPPIVPRSAWGGDLPPTGPLEVEAPGDVRFLLVHHSASSNSYGPDDTVGQLRGFYRFHTGPEKGWPDVAYNFFVDRYGVIYEGRTGSLEQPVMGSATGGSQGFALLCCLVGDHEAEPPTDAAVASLVALLGWLAARYGIDPTGRTSFVSRGSNKHPAGTTVETATIAGHRDMSQTACPGAHGYELVGRLPAMVAAHLTSAGVTAPPPAPAPAVAAPTPTQPVVTVPPTVPPTPIATVPQPVPTPTSTPATPTAPPTAIAATEDATDLAAVPQPLPTVIPPPAPLVVASKQPQHGVAAGLQVTAAGLLAVVAGSVAMVLRRRPPQPQWSTRTGPSSARRSAARPGGRPSGRHRR